MPDALLGFGLPQWQTNGLIEDYAHYRQGEPSGISSAVQDVTGVAARTFRKFTAEHKTALLALNDRRRTLLGRQTRHCPEVQPNHSVENRMHLEQSPGSILDIQVRGGYAPGPR